MNGRRCKVETKMNWEALTYQLFYCSRCEVIPSNYRTFAGRHRTRVNSGVLRQNAQATCGVSKLFAYSDGSLEELELEIKPLLSFEFSPAPIRSRSSKRPFPAAPTLNSRRHVFEGSS